MSAFARSPPLQQDIWYVKVGVLRIILKCNLFHIYWGRSAVFFYFYLSHIYSRGVYELLPRKTLDQRDTLEKKIWTHEMLTRKNFVPTKYPREETLDP